MAAGNSFESRDFLIVSVSQYFPGCHRKTKKNHGQGSIFSKGTAFLLQGMFVFLLIRSFTTESGTFILSRWPL